MKSGKQLDDERKEREVFRSRQTRFISVFFVVVLFLLLSLCVGYLLIK